MKILDLFAGHRAMWFDRQNPNVLFVDHRAEVNPDIVADSTCLPTTVGRGYDLIAFDPPHCRCGANSDMAHDFGSYTKQEILHTVEGAAQEAHRVAVTGALMAMKWATRDIKLPVILDLVSPWWQPLCGQKTANANRGADGTHWLLLQRRPTQG